jgi:hypothetical protein
MLPLIREPVLILSGASSFVGLMIYNFYSGAKVTASIPAGKATLSSWKNY